LVNGYGFSFGENRRPPVSRAFKQLRLVDDHATYEATT
jgi:hypothetical protein